MKLTVPLPPSINDYWRSGVRWARGKAVPYVYRTKEGDAFHAAVAQRALVARVKPLDGDVALRVTVHFENLRRDLDGALKILLDALQGALYHNDRQVKELHVYHRLDRQTPRCEIEVGPSEPSEGADSEDA